MIGDISWFIGVDYVTSSDGDQCSINTPYNDAVLCCTADEDIWALTFICILVYLLVYLIVFHYVF